MPPAFSTRNLRLHVPASLRLYRWLRREAQRIPDPSLRSYYLARVRSEFNSHASERDTTRILLLHERATEQIAFVLGKYLGVTGQDSTAPWGAVMPPSAREIAAKGALLRPSMAAKAGAAVAAASTSRSAAPAWQGGGVAPLTPWDLKAVSHELGLDADDAEGGDDSGGGASRLLR